MTEMAKSPTPLVRMVELEGKGRALVSSGPLRAGQIVLKDSPILLYSALPFLAASQSAQENPNFTYCSHCFKLISEAHIYRSSCPSCSLSVFCSPHCQSDSLSTTHTPWVCQAFKQLQNVPSPLLQGSMDLQVQVRFLFAAYNLAIVSPTNFQTLLSLQGDPSAFLDSPDTKNSTVFLHGLVSSLLLPFINQNAVSFSFSLELTAALLSKDKMNAFGLMEPSSTDKERTVRAYGIYPRASFFNHDCLPNACWFDYVDTTDADINNTDITVRVLHDVPTNREICVSYFPVKLTYSERQQRLKEGYGFTCDCDRCKVEENWSDQEEEELGEEYIDDEDGAVMDEDNDEDMVAGEDSLAQDDSDFPHAYFFLKYACNRENCRGILAPLPPSDSTPSTIMECNSCGYLHNSDDISDGSMLEQ